MEETRHEIEEENTRTRSNTTEEEEEVLEYEEEDIEEGVEKCNHSLVEKLVTDKNINPTWVQTAMFNIWRRPEDFKMVEIRPKLFQFFFHKEIDMRRVLKGNPWMFRNSWLLIKKWERGVNPAEMDFSRTEIKLQIWNMPEHCKTTTLGRKIAARVGEVMECNVFSAGPGKGNFLKASVMIRIEDPLKEGLNMGSKQDGLTKVEFKYERLPTFCYFCGRIGHDVANCEIAEAEEEHTSGSKKGLGAWLRADIIGNKVEHSTEQERPTKMGDKETEKGTQQGKGEVLEKMAKLTMKEKSQQCIEYKEGSKVSNREKAPHQTAEVEIITIKETNKEATDHGEEDKKRKESR
ncbi:uncharacterized protein LOC107483479 [Arachis duranensis]|uniref:Uncharacterized protein LOC107483479 n=1 Tax=Arachis duranensis TaxID=130453 RepID=A0A6P4D1E7_ARADU|nr:uncharacterized protein LOC107483479 [Arachis duranensis]